MSKQIYNKFFKLIAFFLIINMSSLVANSILEDKLIYLKNDKINISKCNNNQWCKIKETNYFIKQFRLKKLNNTNQHKIIANGNTYTYVPSDDIIQYNERKYVLNQIAISDDVQIKKDFKFGYLRTTILNKYYTHLNQEKIQKEEEKLNQEQILKENNKIIVKKEIIEEAQIEPVKKKVKVLEKKEPIIKKVEVKKEKRKILKKENNFSMFQAIGLLAENFEVNRIDSSNVNHPDDIYSAGIEYKIGLANNFSRYYATLRASSGYEGLLSADYITKSKIFFGLSAGYGKFELNDTNSNISGLLYGGQIGYMFNDKFELSYQMLKSNMDEKVSNINYEIDTFNYIILDYKF